MPLTGSQRRAVAARGNVLVVAGAGTGKTSTLVERCLDVVREGCSLENVLMVTFTEAAAAEMRHRLRVALQQLADAEDAPGDGTDQPKPVRAVGRFEEQLALVETARISTLHSFCLGLVRSHFHELGADPEVRVLDEQQCRVLMDETMEALLQDCYADNSFLGEPARRLVTVYGQGWDGIVRVMVRRIHHFSRSLPNPAGWLEEQRTVWSAEDPVNWQRLLVDAFQEWRRVWLPALKPFAEVANVAHCVEALEAVPESAGVEDITAALHAIAEADANAWEYGTKGEARNANKKFFEDAAFLLSTTQEGALREDWLLVRDHMAALLSLTAEFGGRFDRAKRDFGGVDFADLEQLSLRLLRDDNGGPSTIAKELHRRIDYVFVDECQDINGVQDAILRLVGREGAAANRFLVGDVKQSIYQFRLADPRIFLGYERAWAGGGGEGECIALAENYRSRPGILAFVNACFGSLMRASVGGVAYEPLQPGGESPMRTLAGSPGVELHLMRRPGGANGGGESEAGDERNAAEDLSSAEREARLVAWRLRELKDSGFLIWDKELAVERPVDWRDMAVLLRSPRGRTEAFAKEFHRADIPLSAVRAGFLEATEVSDLVCLLQLLDNPLQDIPLLAVLRSPLVGLTLDELAAIRAGTVERGYWLALQRFAERSVDAAPVCPQGEPQPPASHSPPSPVAGSQQPKDTHLDTSKTASTVSRFLRQF